MQTPEEELPAIVNDALNDALKIETEKVLRERGWSLANAEIHTGVKASTIYNMRIGRRSVKIPYVVRFARAVAPPGLEDEVERRWTQIHVHGKTDMPEVDYRRNPPKEVSRTVTDPLTAEMVDLYESLPDGLREAIGNTLREAAKYARHRRGRKAPKAGEEDPALYAAAV